MLDLVRDTENRAVMVAYGRSEDDLRAVLSHSATSIGSDSLAMDPTGPSGIGRPHPRNFGCYPRFLGRYVRDGGIATLERAIEMSTSAAADRVRLRDRGRLVEGAAADIVVFDEAAISTGPRSRTPSSSRSGSTWSWSMDWWWSRATGSTTTGGRVSS